VRFPSLEVGALRAVAHCTVAHATVPAPCRCSCGAVLWPRRARCCGSGGRAGAQVQAEVAALIQGRVLVGHAITNDLTARARPCTRGRAVARVTCLVERPVSSHRGKRGICLVYCARLMLES